MATEERKCSMKTIKCRFTSNGMAVKKTAILTDTLNELSNSQRNEAFDIFSECWAEGYWSVFFEGEPGTQYEIEFKFDTKNIQKTLEPIKAITWENDIITDEQAVSVTTKILC